MKFSFIAIALIAILSAFATKPVKHTSSQVGYYAYTIDGVHFNWTTNDLSQDPEFSCLSTLNATCERADFIAQPGQDEFPESENDVEPDGSVYVYTPE